MSVALRFVRVVIIRFREVECGRVERNSSIRRRQIAKPRPLWLEC